MTTTLPQTHEKARRTPEGYLEFRIAFSHPLTNAARVPNNAPLPPVRLPQPKVQPQSIPKTRRPHLHPHLFTPKMLEICTMR